MVEVGLDGGLHLGILQLHRQLAAIEALRLVHLAKRGRRCRLLAEALELRAPIRAKLGGHAAAHERPAHGRRLVLKLRQLVGVFGRDRVGDGREQLCDLHQRALEAAQRRGELHRLLLVVLAAEQVAGAHPRRHAAGRAADARIALHAAREAVALAVVRLGGIGLVIPAGTVCQNVHSAQMLRRRPPTRLRWRRATHSR